MFEFQLPPQSTSLISIKRLFLHIVWELLCLDKEGPKFRAQKGRKNLGFIEVGCAEKAVLIQTAQAGLVSQAVPG